MILLVISATCASLSSHDLFARCAVTPVRNFLCKNWSIIVSIDKQIKVWLAYRFFEGHLPWNPPLNNPLRWVRSCSIRTPNVFPNTLLNAKDWKPNYILVFRLVLVFFGTKFAELGAGGERERERREIADKTIPGSRQRGVSRAVIHHYLTVDTDNPPTANHSPAFSLASQSEGRGWWRSGVTLSGLTTGPWWMIGLWSMVCCKLGCIIPHQFTGPRLAQADTATAQKISAEPRTDFV